MLPDKGRDINGIRHSHHGLLDRGQPKNCHPGARLRHRTLFSVAELNQAVRELLSPLKERP
jgi:hypothetical protein